MVITSPVAEICLFSLSWFEAQPASCSFGPSVQHWNNSLHSHQNLVIIAGVLQRQHISPLWNQRCGDDDVGIRRRWCLFGVTTILFYVKPNPRFSLAVVVLVLCVFDPPVCVPFWWIPLQLCVDPVCSILLLVLWWANPSGIRCVIVVDSILLVVPLWWTNHSDIRAYGQSTGQLLMKSRAVVLVVVENWNCRRICPTSAYMYMNLPN